MSQKQHFTIDINAPVAKVWDTMLNLDTYKQWTTPFMEGSTYEGSWNQGEKIKFLGPDGGGMFAEIAENRLHEYISIRHLGFIKDGIIDTTSPEVVAWTPAYENYTFSEKDGITTVDVELDVADEKFMAMMNEMWPKALAKLKEISE